MSMDQANEIDAIVTPSEKSDNKLIMIIADADNFESQELREKAFFSKVSYYFNIILSDSFKTQYPDVAMNAVVINVRSASLPTQRMLQTRMVALPGEAANPDKRIQIVFTDSSGQAWQ